jgi:hypothetical protein
MEPAALLVLPIYIAIAVALFIVVGRTLERGYAREFWRATVLGLFFSLTLAFGHGVAVVPAFVILVGCIGGGCDEYGLRTFLAWVAAPMLVQWALLVAVFCLLEAGRRQNERIAAGKSLREERPLPPQS